MTEQRPFEVRIGNDDREQAVAALRQHYSAGRLNAQEYEDRSVSVGQARTWQDLDPVFGDLPEPRPAPGRSIAPVAGPALAGGSAGPVTTAQAGSGAPQGLIPEQYAPWVMALLPFVAVILFFVTGSWLWFLAIPIAGVVAYGPGGKRGHRDRGRRDRR
jgi:Domain of unknown function (DUF1707)